MTRHPTARKLPHDAQAKEDAFIAGVLETTTWARQNSRRLAITAIVIVAATLIALYYRNYRAGLRERAETELSQVRTTALAGNAALAVRDLEAFMTRFGSTPAAAEARLLLAKAYLESGEAQKAVDLLADQARDVGSPLGVSATLLVASAQESLGQPDAAVQTLLRVADGAEAEYQRFSALEAAARLRFEQNDAAGAVALYDRILSALAEDSPDRQVIQMRRAEAAARGQGT
jgi:predicted negative regulator of RcsB-dependent stress response